MTTDQGKTREFPSAGWFRALAEATAADEPRYRKLGYVEIKLGVNVGEHGYRMTFEDFGCSEVEEWDGSGEAVDCAVSASPGDWQSPSPGCA